MNWTEFMFLPGGQTKVSLSLVAAAIMVKHVGSPGPHASSVAGSCGPKRDNTAAAPRIPVGQGKRVPVRPGPGKRVPVRPTHQPRKQVHLAYY